MRTQIGISFILSVSLFVLPDAMAQASFTFGLDIYDGETADLPAISAYDYRLSVPFTFGSGRVVFTNRLMYRHVDKASPHTLGQDDAFMLHSHAYFYEGVLSAAVVDGWRASATVLPVYQSALDRTPGPFRVALAGSAVATRELGEARSVGFGVAHSRTFGRALVHPVLQLTWHHERFAADLNLPEQGTAVYSVASWLDVGAFGRTDGDVYRLGEDAESEISFVNVTTGPFMQVRATEMVQLDARVGTTVYRSVETREALGRITFDPSRTSYLRFGATLALR